MQTQDLQKLLEHIEAHLEQSLSVGELADQAGYSRWHFQRVFVAVTGLSPAGYIRARRLSEAARYLRETHCEILPLALRYGFESQAAFTRAFRQHFGLTPGAARSSNSQLTLQQPLQILTFFGGPMLKPDFVTEPPRTVVGFRGRFMSALSPAANNLDVIPGLWQQLFPRISEIQSADPELSLGVILAEPDCEGELDYLAGKPVTDTDNIPEGMVALELPGGLYARFTHTGPLSEIRTTMSRIYTEWAPQSGCEFDQRPDLEVYDHRFRPDLGQTTFDVLVPVKRAL